MVVYRVNMFSGDKEEVDLSKHPYESEKFFKEEVNNWNYFAALQAKIKADSNRNGPLWLYYWV